MGMQEANMPLPNDSLLELVVHDTNAITFNGEVICDHPQNRPLPADDAILEQRRLLSPSFCTIMSKTATTGPENPLKEYTS